MEKPYNKFKNIRKFCEGIVSAHKEGKPFNPAGCRGTIFMFVCEETDKEYKGLAPVFGTHIQANSAKSFCAAVNKVLDEGGEVLSHRAYTLGMMLRCPIIQAKKGEEGVSETEESTITEETAILTGESGEQADNQGSSTDGDSADTTSTETVTQDEQTPEETSGDSDEEVQASPEVEELQGATEVVQSSEPTESDVQETSGDNEKPVVDWEAVTAMTKKEIDAYAKTLGVELHGNLNKDNMIATFKEELAKRG